MSRLLYDQRMHHIYPIVGTVCTRSAAAIPGAVVNQVVFREALKKGKMRIGHPASIDLGWVKMEGDSPVLARASIGRAERARA